jgi:hypothetical protein
MLLFLSTHAHVSLTFRTTSTALAVSQCHPGKHTHSETSLLLHCRRVWALACVHCCGGTRHVKECGSHSFTNLLKSCS